MARVETVLVSSTKAYEATGPDGSVVTVKNLGPDSCVYATASTVSSGSNDGTLTSGSSLAFAPSKYFLSSGTSNLQVTAAVGDQFRQYDKDNGQAGIIVPGTPAISRASSALTASRAYVMRFRPSRPMTITTVAFTVSSFSATDDAVDVGIFNSALTTLLVSSGSTTGKLNTSNGVKTVTITATALQAGTTYYAGFASGASGAPASVEMSSFGSSASVTLFGSTAGLIEQSFQASAFPLAVPFTVAGAVGSCPLMALRES